MNNWTDDNEFLQTFRAEALERLHTLSSGLMALESAPEDQELLKKLFREAHTLKGSAGMMGLEAIQELAHRVENILETVQKGKMQMGGEVADLLLETLDRIEELLPGEGMNAPVSEVSGLLERLTEIGAGLEGSASTAGAAGSKNVGRNDGGEPGTGPKPAAGGGHLSDVSQAKGDAGAAPPLKTGVTGDPTGGGALAGARAFAAAGMPAGRQTPKAPAPVTGQRESTIRVNINKLDSLLNLMGEIIVNQSGSEDRAKEMGNIFRQTAGIRKAFGSLSSQLARLDAAGGGEALSQIRQQVNSMEAALDTAVDRLGAAAYALKENTAARRVALDGLQDRAMRVRMLPLASIFSLYPRVVRDAAGSCGKKVKLELSGEKTEMDKRILEQVADPLMHIIRNSVDHGIELPADRAAQGKPETGLIRLSAAQRGDRVEIEISDDGAGIIPEKIKATAQRKGLLEAGLELSREDALKLIFRPGFSTAESVTTISGRGVGLDVVKNNIEELEGSVLVESSPGAGTRFLVSLPVTLAVIDGMLVESAGSRFIIPMSAVQELVAVAEGDLQTLGNHPGFMLRGGAIPLVGLTQFLGGPPAARSRGKIQVVVAATEHFRLGLEVEKLLGQQEIVIKPLGGFLPRMPYVAGVTIMGDGEAVLVINAGALARDVKEGERSGWRTAEAGPEEGAVLAKPAVLVVEDSLVVRELERNILEAAGFEVRTAVDGNDALARLLERPVDCVVTDIEMPGMDGISLTAAIRHNSETKDIPVVMVTSRNSEEDKRLGVEAGANAYVTKGSFDQQNLLETVRRLVA